MDLNMRNTVVNVSLEALEANKERAITWNQKDEHITLVLRADSETKLTVKAGNGIQGVTDLVLTVPAGISLVKLESGRFKNVSGENKGKIVVVSTGTPEIAAVAIV